MRASDPLRDTVARLDEEIRRALAAPGPRAAGLEAVRRTATLALDLAGGRPGALREDVPPAWAQDTLTECELSLAFVLGCVERALRQPERTTHLLRDAHERVAGLVRELGRARAP